MLPKHIDILGRRFKIILTEDIEVEGNIAGASVDFDHMEIEIDSQQGQRLKMLALLHETAHIGLDVSGIDQRLSRKMVEVICQTMANTYYDFIISFYKSLEKNQKK
jgi:hypothetical protein